MEAAKPEEGDEDAPPAGNMPPGLLPQHKAAVVLFLERVYSIEDQRTFFRLLEDCFLPDLRAATTLDQVGDPLHYENTLLALA